MKTFILSVMLALACVTGLSAAPEPPPPNDEICMDSPVIEAGVIQLNADFLPLPCASAQEVIKFNSFPDPCFVAFGSPHLASTCLAPIPPEQSAEFNSNRQRISNNGSTLQKDPGNPVTISTIGASSAGGLARLRG